MKVITVGTRRGDINLRHIDNTLDDLQHEVCGYIQTCAPAQLRTKNIEMLVNEEGLLIGLDMNENLLPFFFVGPAVFVGVDGEDFCSLTKFQMNFVKEWLEKLHTEWIS